MVSELHKSLTWQCNGDRCSSMLMDCRLSEHGTSLEQSSRFTTFWSLASQWYTTQPGNTQVPCCYSTTLTYTFIYASCAYFTLNKDNGRRLQISYLKFQIQFFLHSYQDRHKTRWNFWDEERLWKGFVEREVLTRQLRNHLLEVLRWWSVTRHLDLSPDHHPAGRTHSWCPGCPHTIVTYKDPQMTQS